MPKLDLRLKIAKRRGPFVLVHGARVIKYKLPTKLGEAYGTQH